MEPALAFRVFRQYMEDKYGVDAKYRIIVTTDAKTGLLREIAHNSGYRQFEIPANVGGRYSVLTPVGLLPLAVAGIDIHELMHGAKVAATEFSAPVLEDNEAYRYAVLRHALHTQGYKVELLASFEPALKHHVGRFVFSSSATVYGDNQVPFVETMSLLPTTNPYGETKAMSERILTDVANVNSDFAVTLLRYFNPVGAHESGLIGEAPNGIPNNLMPYVTQVAKGKLKQLRVFGNDYPTVDGTGVRDYIHVLDLAAGHVAAIERLTEGVHVYNLGTGKGTSVLQLVKAFEEANEMEVPFEVVERRSGDIASCYADATKAQQQLGWTAKRDLIAMCRDAWRFEKNYKE